MNDFQIFSYVGFSKDKQAYWSYNSGSDLSRNEIKFGEDISLNFDLSKRYCTGWHDLETGKDSVCDERQVLEAKYNQCQKCQAKTGFNPAFYNADSVSEVQQKRNSQPHFVYLAYFDDNFTKVGISFEGRGIARLLEQGAKAAMILDTFNSAMVARKYEAEISRLNNFVENVKLNKKLDLLTTAYNSKQAEASLNHALKQIDERLDLQFPNAKFINLFDNYFAPDFDKDQLNQIVDMTDQAQISGNIIGLYGTILLCQYQNDILALPIKKFLGYKFDKSDQIIPIELPTQQFSLF